MLLQIYLEDALKLVIIQSKRKHHFYAPLLLNKLPTGLRLNQLLSFELEPGFKVSSLSEQLRTGRPAMTGI